MTIFTQPIAEMIWDLKYRYREGGVVLDRNIDDTWHRVAKAVAMAEKPELQKSWEQAFYHLLEDFKFLPGGRILAGAGTHHHVTLFNCFVMNIAEDSLPGIFTALSEGALTLQQGGGVGYDFSILRPHGDKVATTGIAASGPVSFMRIWDAMCSVLLSTGARRGAMMGVLRCDHPDIEEFIEAKADPHLLRHFNVSVMVSDAFMQAVQNNDEWPLVFPVDKSLLGEEIVYRQVTQHAPAVPCRVYRYVKARELWDKIIRSAYHYAEPGVLFGDTINRMNNLWYREQIHATNPCGEIPLPAYGACDLGAINLTQLVMAPFTAQAQLNWEALEETTALATRFLDNIVDVSRYPLSTQRDQAMGTRRIGLGLTGLADMFVMLGIRYGSAESIQLSHRLMERIAHVTWQTSVDLAAEKGSFPFFHPDYLEGQFVKTLSPELQSAIRQKGMRNSHHNTIAPAGTISLLANNISNGIEPIFQAEYQRHVRVNDKEPAIFSVKDYAYHQWQTFQTECQYPDAWVDTHTLSPDAHLAIQGVMQQYVDNAISKTINIPVDFPFEKVMEVYTEAYRLGLKGCTIFRPNAITGSVLHINAEESTDRCCQFEE